MRINITFLSVILFLTLPVCILSAKKDNSFEISKNSEIFHNVLRTIDNYYVDSVDIGKIVNNGIENMLLDIDPYTVYYPQNKQSDIKMLTTGKYAGIGAIIRKYQDCPWIVVEEPYQNMPAHRAGLKAGDEILRVDGMDMKNKTTEFVSDNLRGAPNSKLTVTVRRPGVQDTLDIEIVRSAIALPPVPYYGIINGYGYILLDSFTEGCSQIVRNAVTGLMHSKIKGVILDLRNNGGGLLDEAVKIAGLFVPEGTVITTTRGAKASESREYATKSKPVDTKIPLAVLVNNASASASEIVSGALQDLDRAVIIGNRTFGKGLVQSTRTLPYGGTLKITTAKYYIPSGRCIQAIDYSKHNSNGKGSLIPDSLTSIFYTMNGRQVRDGGGIRPDIECKLDTMSELLYAISVSKQYFDYLNNYCVGHKTIAPLKEFSVTDADYRDFKKFMTDNGFKYKNATNHLIEDLKQVAKEEHLYNIAKEQIEALENKVAYDADRDMDAISKDIRILIATNLATRYYFQSGAVQQGLKDDIVLDSAINVLGNKTRLKALLGNQN
ncbi:MAG: S41 family peptidase [Bacteroidaceae bacterium]|nr:S41 family peptidase [Bacteroidaceae bacterium]